MTPTIDALTSPTLKHLREAWWGSEFTEFLAETLRPRPGNRILDVGCGEGLAEVAIGGLHISQVRLVGVDLFLSKIQVAKKETLAHNQRVDFAAADACSLPFRNGTFDSIYSVAVLQHVKDAEVAVSEFARVTAPRGRLVVVEPDISARYGFSSTPSGRRAFELSGPFFAALGGPQTKASLPIGPHLPRLFSEHDVEPIDVRLFPVSQTWLGAPEPAVWRGRRQIVEQALGPGASDAARWLGREYLETLDAYEAEARAAGSSFVEIQHTMLFATVGQKRD